jgi:hypothetical protein
MMASLLNSSLAVRTFYLPPHGLKTTLARTAP